MVAAPVSQFYSLEYYIRGIPVLLSVSTQDRFNEIIICFLVLRRGPQSGKLADSSSKPPHFDVRRTGNNEEVSYRRTHHQTQGKSQLLRVIRLYVPGEPKVYTCKKKFHHETY